MACCEHVFVRGDGTPLTAAALGSRVSRVLCAQTGKRVSVRVIRQALSTAMGESDLAPSKKAAVRRVLRHGAGMDRVYQRPTAERTMGVYDAALGEM